MENHITKNVDPNYRGTHSKAFLIRPFQSPHRHYTHSQQPHNSNEECGEHGPAGGLPQYTIDCAGEDKKEL